MLLLWTDLTALPGPAGCPPGQLLQRNALGPRALMARAKSTREAGGPGSAVKEQIHEIQLLAISCREQRVARS